MLFQIYGSTSATQLLGWVLVFAGLIIMNEIGRRTKAGGILIFVIIPIILTVYFIGMHLGAFGGASNTTMEYMDGWLLQTLCSRYRMCRLHDDQVQVGHWCQRLVQAIPMVDRSSQHHDRSCF